MESVLSILREGDPRLRQPAAPVAALDADVRHDLGRAFATLADFRRRHGFGRALAAPQLGLARRLIAVDLGAGPFALFNPEVTWRSDDTFEVWDDCFSVPDKLVRVRRHRSISLVYRDERWRLRRWERLPPELAELVQHEVDHLDGVLMTDRAHGPGAVRPAAERGHLIDGARPRHRLSLEAIAAAAVAIDPVFRGTPQYLSEPLSAALGCTLHLKVETVNPIRSFKGRGTDYFVQRLLARGGARSLVTVSAGNFGQGLAYACRKAGLSLVVYTARDANALKVERMRALGAEVRQAPIAGAAIAGAAIADAPGDDGDGVPGGFDPDGFDAAKREARRWAAATGALMVEDGADTEVAEGAGSIAVELLARGDAFDAVLVPLGDGALITGVARWIKAASPATAVIGVASRGAPAMAESWRRGPGAPPVRYARAHTIADGIEVCAPVAAALADMHGLVDDVLLVDDATLIEAMRLGQRHAGLVLEPAGVAGLAALVADPARFAGQTVATVLAGGNVTPEQKRAWLDDA